ncbi:MAG: nucleotidyltransferase family protein [Oscillospiraceae bacterium]|nr:nucleotidyltransferase family protein [Oscillospiraceae bacterium]
MELKGVSREQWGLIYLTRCALRGEDAEPEKLAGLDLQRLLSLAKKHSMNAMAARPLRKVLDPETMLQWKKAMEKAMRKNILLDTERRILCAEMEVRGIWYMPLKGSILKDLYPTMDMRQMSDQDILYDASYREEICRMFLARGYTQEGREDSHHDTYHKEPVYNIEMHHALIEEGDDIHMAKYYRNVKDRLIPDKPGGFGHHFTDEDFYVYMTAHAYRHYVERGIGIRALVDIHVYENKKPNLDWSYIEKECAKLRIDGYEKRSRILSRKLFGSEQIQELDEGDLDLLIYSFDAGTHGSEAGFIDHELKRMQKGGKISFWTKIRFLFRRLFPSPEWMMQKNKKLRQHPWMIPFAWIGRLFRGAFRRREHTVKELRYIMDTEEK